MSKIEEVYKGCREFEKENLPRKIVTWLKDSERASQVLELWDFARRFLGWQIGWDHFTEFVFASSSSGEPRTHKVKNLSMTDESEIQILELFRRLKERAEISHYPLLNTGDVLNNLFYLAEQYAQEEEDIYLDEEDGEEFWDEIYHHHE